MLDGETGLVVDGRSVRAVAEAVVALLEDPSGARAMGEKGRAWIEREWRWEVQARRKWLLRYGSIAALSDVSQATVNGLAANRWTWSRMGTAVSDVDTLAHRARTLGLTPTREATLIGYIVQRALGDPPSFAPSTARTYERLAERIGTTDALGSPESGEASTIRLDWTTGLELADA